MQTYYTLGKLIVLIAIVTNCAFLLIQVWATSKYRQRCFALLAGGAAFGILYSVVAGASFFVPFSLQAHLLLLQVSIALVACGSVLGVWGMVLLVHSYRQV
jgi:hypothetical protein